MVQVSYPGVYIEEVPSGVRTITGVATSITAFVGYARKGLMDQAVLLTSFADFERSYGGLERDCPMSYAVRQFYANGGGLAWVVRVARNASTAQWSLADGGGTAVLSVSAASPGTWGNVLGIRIEHTSARNPDSEFNLSVYDATAGTDTDLGQAVVLETHRNLTMDKDSAQYVESVVNTASTRVRVVVNAGLVFGQPGHARAAAFVASADATVDRLIGGTVFSATESGLTSFLLDLSGRTWSTIGELVTEVNAEIATDASLAAQLLALEDPGVPGMLRLESRTAGAHSLVSIALGATGGLAALLKLGSANGGAEVTGAAEHRPAATVPANAVLKAPTTGSDGLPPGGAELTGVESTKTGMYALLDVDLFNLLVLPETAALPDVEGIAVLSAAINLCKARRAFLIADPPYTKTRTTVEAWAQPLRGNGSYAATYFPATKVIDPLDGFRPRTLGASGTLAGIYARTDATRGVWKAPAGADATLNGVIDLAERVNDLEQGPLNQAGVNVLRTFPAQGRVAWGARTLRGSDALADEYKYIPIRRLALFIEESLYRGTQWAVFEPNDEPMWAQIRLNLGTFMNGLFRQGAFQGRTPQEAYFVKCDKDTTTQADRNLGIVNIIVGFAPLKPAEFVVIKIQQIAGDLQ